MTAVLLLSVGIPLWVGAFVGMRGFWKSLAELRRPSSTWRHLPLYLDVLPVRVADIRTLFADDGDTALGGSARIAARRYLILAVTCCLAFFVLVAAAVFAS